MFCFLPCGEDLDRAVWVCCIVWGLCHIPSVALDMLSHHIFLIHGPTLLLAGVLLCLSPKHVVIVVRDISSVYICCGNIVNPHNEVQSRFSDHCSRQSVCPELGV